MKKTKKTKAEGEGLSALLGKQVTLFCLNYIYSGRLSGVTAHDVRLEDASVVYETGAFTTTVFKDSQKLPGTLFVRTSAIESYTILLANG